MSDPRYAQLADVLTGFSTSLKKGERVLIDAFDVLDTFTIALVRAGQKDSALAVVKSNEGKVSMDQLRDLFQDITRQEIEKVAGGEKPMLFLDDAHARSIQGPATMDGIGPTQGWEIYWMEVDVKRRRGAPWAAPVPSEIAGKIRHLSAAE